MSCFITLIVLSRKKRYHMIGLIVFILEKGREFYCFWYLLSVEKFKKKADHTFIYIMIMFVDNGHG